MDTKIIELRMVVRALRTDNKDVQLAVKSEVLRLAELLDKQLAQSNTVLQSDLPNICLKCNWAGGQHSRYCEDNPNTANC